MFGNLGAGELLMLLILIILWLTALTDILLNNFQGNNKIVWILVVIFIPIMGAILYLTIGRNQKLKN